MKRPMLSLAIAALQLGGCAHSPQPLPLRGTGDLGVVVERATGTLQLIESSTRTSLARIDGLGDLSHASVVFSRDQRYAYVFGRDGGLTKVDLLLQQVDKRAIPADSGIGGDISRGATLVAVGHSDP